MIKDRSLNNVPVGIKYQGSATTAFRKRGFRITFYKNSTYSKKDKVKIGEMVKLSGYNMKSYPTDTSRIKDPIFSNMFIEMWENRNKNVYPWVKSTIKFKTKNNSDVLNIINYIKYFVWGYSDFIDESENIYDANEVKDVYSADGRRSFETIDGSIAVVGNTPFDINLFIEFNKNIKLNDSNAITPVSNGATGMIKSFPIETYFDNEFYGLQLFSVKKDEKNYMLDGDDDHSGIFVSNAVTHNWLTSTASDWEDEMMDDMSDETTNTLNEFLYYIKGFINGTIIIDGETVEFKNSMLEERIDLPSWIDYWIGVQILQLWDNAYHNVILYSGSDKKKFYPFFYDLDNSLNISGYDSDIMDLVGSGSVWVKFTDEYKDCILNRYYELRKTVLSDKNIESIYKSYIQNIPQTVIDKEKNRWGSGDPKSFDNIFNKLKQRLNWLDNNNFNL